MLRSLFPWKHLSAKRKTAILVTLFLTMMLPHPLMLHHTLSSESSLLKFSTLLLPEKKRFSVFVLVLKMVEAVLLKR